MKTKKWMDEPVPADLHYALDDTFCDGETLRRAAQEYGTPLLVYDRRTLEDRAAMIREAFAWQPNSKPFFPVWAADNPELLRILCQAGCGALCGNALQIRLACMAGFSGEEILFHACYPSRRDMDTALRAGAAVSLDAGWQLEWISPAQYGDRVLGLRLRPRAEASVGIFGHGKLHSKFGMPRNELLETAGRAAAMGFHRLGLQMQAGSQVYTPGYFASELQELVQLAAEVRQQTGITVSWLDLGGGLYWSHQGNYTLNLTQEANALREKFQAVLEQEGLEQTGLLTELGDYLAAPAGVLLTTVRTVREYLFTDVGLDMSAADLSTKLSASPILHISKLGCSDIRPRKTYYLFGWPMNGTCRFGGRHILPLLQPGDILLFHGVGSACRSMASNFAGNLRCPEVLLERDGTIRLIRRRETEEDFLATLQTEQQGQR